MEQPVSERIYFHQPEMLESERRQLSSLIESVFGIKMPQSKKQLLQGRLAKRLRLLKLKSFREYYNYLTEGTNGSTELVELINEVSTNKTNFFREPAHFKFLADKILPLLLKENIGTVKPLKIWSAGCSSGEEPYSLAMEVESFKADRRLPDYNYRILATDISTRTLQKGVQGIYMNKDLEALPGSYLKRYTMKSKDPHKLISRIVPEIRHRIEFQRLNFLQHYYRWASEYHVIFCRNVFIYFADETKNEILAKFEKVLVSKGFLFTGHSESILNLSHGFQLIAPAVYRRIL